MYEILSIHSYKKIYFYIVKGEYMSDSCLTLFKSYGNYDLGLIKGYSYNIEFLLSQLIFVNRMYVSDISSEEYILDKFSRIYLSM